MTFRDSWNDFSETCVHPEKRSKIDFENLRRTFYAGAMVAAAMIIDDVDGIKPLLVELETFFKEVQDERREQRVTTSRRKKF